MVHVIEASSVGWRGFCVSDGEEAAPDHSSRPRSGVKTKPESSDVHSLCGDDTCVYKCAWLCVPFMSLQCPDVSNNHSPPVVLLSFWFMQWHYDGITLLVFIWKATGLMLLLISSNWPGVPLIHDSGGILAMVAEFHLFLWGVKIAEPQLIWNLITFLTPPARANYRC